MDDDNNDDDSVMDYDSDWSDRSVLWAWMTDLPADCLMRRIALIDEQLTQSHIVIGRLVWDLIVEELRRHFAPWHIKTFWHNADFMLQVIAQANSNHIPPEFRRDGYTFEYLRHQHHDTRYKYQELESIPRNRLLPLSDEANIMAFRCLTTSVHGDITCPAKTPSIHIVDTHNAFSSDIVLGISSPHGLLPVFFHFSFCDNYEAERTNICQREHCLAAECDHRKENHCTKHNRYVCQHEYQSHALILRFERTRMLQIRRVTPFPGGFEGLLDQFGTFVNADFSWLQQLVYSFSGYNHGRSAEFMRKPPETEPWKNAHIVLPWHRANERCLTRHREYLLEQDSVTFCRYCLTVVARE